MIDRKNLNQTCLSLEEKNKVYLDGERECELDDELD